MTGVNSMQKKAGRPKKEGKHATPPRPHIGGMETLGPLPVGGVKTKHKPPSTNKRTNAGVKAEHYALGFGKK